MFKGLLLILLLLVGLAFYAVDQAEKIDTVMVEAKTTYPDIDEYFAVVEMLHYQALQRSYDATVNELIPKLPPSLVSHAQFLKKIDVKNAAMSLEKELDRLTQKISFIDPSLALLPSRSWIYRYSSAAKLTTQKIPSYAMQTIYYMRPKTDTYSIENLKKVFEYRNMAVSGCNRYVQPMSDTNLNGVKECEQIKATLMEKDWQQWFDASGEKRRLLPRLKNSIAELATLKHASLEVCNLAPYKTQYVIEYPIEDGAAKVAGWYYLDAGDCLSRTEQFINTEPAFWVHVSTADWTRFGRITDQISKAFLEDADSRNDHYASEVVPERRDTTQCVANDVLRFTAPISERGVCPADRPLRAGFIMAMARNESREEWNFFAEHRYLTHFDPFELGRDPNVKQSAIKYAKMLSKAIDTQEAFEKSDWNGNSPFSLGGTIVDYNGPLNQGVKLVDVAARSIDDVPLPYREGDTLISLNGHIVFGASDLNHWLNEHGFSLSGGYDVPLTVVLMRDGQMIQHRVSYFFNSSHPQFQLATKGWAAYHGGGSLALLGMTAGAACSTANVLTSTGNVLKFVGNFIDNLSSNPSSSSQQPYTELLDMKQCLWGMNQLKAIAKQRHKEIYETAGWFALALPSPLRMLALEENGGLGLAGGLLGKGALQEARIVALEMALWSLGTSAPELTWQAKIDRAKEMATMGAGLGFVMGTLTGK